jgi:lysophospholipase L1-like esterase
MAYVPFVRNATTSRINLIKEYNQVIRDLNLYHALPAASPDLFTHFSDPANQDQFFDDVHPNGDGYIDVAGLWYERLISGNILN